MIAMTAWRSTGALLLALLAGPALAHKSSDAYVTLQVHGDTVTQRIDVALRDIDRDLALDANDDGVLDWGEVRRRWPEIQALATQGLQVRAEAGAQQPWSLDLWPGQGNHPLGIEPPVEKKPADRDNVLVAYGPDDPVQPCAAEEMDMGAGQARRVRS